MINLDEEADVGTHWITIFCSGNEIVYFDRKKNKIANIFRVQANNSVMCAYFCIGFIDFMLANKKMIDFTSLFTPHDFEKNDNILLSYFKDE